MCNDSEKENAGYRSTVMAALRSQQTRQRCHRGEYKGMTAEAALPRLPFL